MSKKILIVDDEYDSVTLLQLRLEAAGFEVYTAYDGLSGIDAAISLRPDVILLDIMMPVMDGIALALAVARDYPNLPILLMTGFADQRERAFGLESLVSDVVSKPFTLAEIRTAVARALVGRPATEKIA